MTISQRLFSVMKAKKMTQVELSKRTGIPNGTISDWKIKKTNPGADKIAIIAKSLDVTTDYLLTGEEPQSTSNIPTGDVVGGAVVTGNNHGNVNVRNVQQFQKQTIPTPWDIQEVTRIMEAIEPKKRNELLNIAYKMEENS